MCDCRFPIGAFISINNPGKVRMDIPPDDVGKLLHVHTEGNNRYVYAKVFVDPESKQDVVVVRSRSHLQ